MHEGWGVVPERLRAAMLTAQAEGRLDWRVTDAHGRPSNGGSAEPLGIGEWSPIVDHPKICASGWHTTNDPLKWSGRRVWLVECDRPSTRDDDKRVSQRIRPLGEVDPQRCFDPRIGARLGRRDLSGADLGGANLSGADLSGADLSGTSLSGANLSGADLSGTNLRGANLYGTSLYGANLSGTNLRWVDFRRADLSGADLYGANLYSANLSGTNLRWVDLGDWERGPDGMARKLAGGEDE